MARSSHRRRGFAQEQLKDLRDRISFTKPRKPRLSGAVVHRRVMTVRGAYKIAHKRSLGLGGRGPSEGSARQPNSRAGACHEFGASTVDSLSDFLVAAPTVNAFPWPEL
jgi:hypothetical protein